MYSLELSRHNVAAPVSVQRKPSGSGRVLADNRSHSAICQRMESDKVGSSDFDGLTEKNTPVQLVRKKKKGAKKTKINVSNLPFGIGDEVAVAHNTIGPQYPLKKGTTGILQSFSKSGKTATIEITGDPLLKKENVQVKTSDIQEIGAYNRIKEKDDNRNVLNQRLKTLDIQQRIMPRTWLTPKQRASAAELALLLKRAPLTVNIRVSDLANYKTPEILNGFEVRAKRKSHAGIGNIANDDQLKKRYYYEHVAFGFPYPYNNSNGVYENVSDAKQLPRDTWGPGHMGASTLDQTQPKYTYEDPSLRPRYGALDFRNSGRGATPDPDWYGTSYILLKEKVKYNCTFSLGDTWDVADQPMPGGSLPVLVTQGNLDLILLKMMQDESSHAALEDLKNDDLEADKSVYQTGETYIEAQIHQPIHFGTDVEAIFLSRNELTEKYKGGFNGTVRSARKCIDPAGRWSSKVRISLIG